MGLGVPPAATAAVFLCLHCPGLPGPAPRCCAHGDGNSGHLAFLVLF